MSAEHNAPPAWIVPGAVADYHAAIGGPVTLAGVRVRTTPHRLCGHWSVFVEGKASSVDCEALTPAPDVVCAL